MITTFKGEIDWFDKLSGKGMVRSDCGQYFFLHFTAIDGVDKNNYHWPKEGESNLPERGQICFFRIYGKTDVDYCVLAPK